MDDFKKSSFKIQHALDITDQEKGRLAILEKLQIYENETVINIKQLKTEMMNSIENSSSDISAELKLLKESASLTGKSLSEALLFGEHGENMLCTEYVLNVKNNFCTPHC